VRSMRGWTPEVCCASGAVDFLLQFAAAPAADSAMAIVRNGWRRIAEPPAGTSLQDSGQPRALKNACADELVDRIIAETGEIA
jgi:hypothetical protein